MGDAGRAGGLRAAGGDIVNTASLSGLGPVPGYAVYAATKAAMVSGSPARPRRPACALHALCPDVVQTALLTQDTPRSAPTWPTPAGGS